MERAQLPGTNVLRVRVGLCPNLKHERLSRHQSRYCKSIVCSLMDDQVKQQQQYQEGRPGVRASTVKQSISLQHTNKTNGSHKKDQGKGRQNLARVESTFDQHNAVRAVQPKIVEFDGPSIHYWSKSSRESLEDLNRFGADRHGYTHSQTGQKFAYHTVRKSHIY